MERLKLSSEGIKNRIQAHPVAALVMAFMFISGAAVGISTGLSLNHAAALMQRLSFGAGASWWMQALAYLRTVMVNVFVFSLLFLSVYAKSILPVACAAVLFKGFLVGFSGCELAVELGWLGALYGVVCVLLPSIVTYTALQLTFFEVSQKKQKERAAPGEALDDACRRRILRNGILLLFGSILECCMLPLVYRWIMSQ